MIFIKKNDVLFELHKEALMEKIRNEIDDKILKWIYVTVNKENIFITPKLQEIVTYFRDHIEDFVVANNVKQRILINTVALKDSSLTKKYNKNDAKSDSYKLIRYIFESRGYNEFTKGFKYNNNEEEYGAYTFVKLLNKKTCPYCNRNYISVIEKENENDKQRRPELDHFHPKSIYPFLAVNYYNLIPSCSTCNKLKSDDDSLKLLHPYNKQTKEVNITYWLNDMKFYKAQSLKDIDFESEKFIDIEIENLPENHKQVFQLERLYQEHKDVVIELILKHLHYPQTYINELSEFGFSEEEIYRFVFSNYLEDLDKKPLAKLTKDIADELGLL